VLGIFRTGIIHGWDYSRLGFFRAGILQDWDYS